MQADGHRSLGTSSGQSHRSQQLRIPMDHWRNEALMGISHKDAPPPSPSPSLFKSFQISSSKNDICNGTPLLNKMPNIFVILFKNMLNSESKAIHIINDAQQQKETIPQFSNPISKTTFQALPRIYGKKKKKKYTIKYDFQDKDKQTLKPRAYPVHHCIQSNQRLTESRGMVKQIEVNNIKSRREKTQIRNAIKNSAEKLSKPRLDICLRRYCFCNKQHNQNIARSASKDQTKSHFRGRSIRLPQISRDIEPDDIESKHKVAGISTIQNDSERKQRPFTLLDLLRNSRKTSNQRRQLNSGEKSEEDNEDSQSQPKHRHKHTISVFVQTQPDQPQANKYQTNLQQNRNKSRQVNRPQSSEEDFNTGLQYQTSARENEQSKLPQSINQANQSINFQRPIQKKIKSNAEQQENQEEHEQQMINKLNLKGLTANPFQKSPQQQEKQARNIESGSKMSDYGPDRNKHLQSRLATLKQQYQNNESASQNDDSRSISSSLSAASISKYVFEKGKNPNTIFQALNRQESVNSGESKMRVKSQKLKNVDKEEGKAKKTKYTYQKKNGLFIIPEQDEYVSFLKDYQPMSDKLKLKNLIKSENFKVVKQEDGVYFGQLVDSQKHGKGIMVTEKTIFQGKYNKDVKIQGCERNIDGIYRGQFANGQREGYGTFQWNNGQVFEGQWKNGTKNGYGTWKSPKGDFYQGQWKMNRQHGKGVFKHRLSTYRGYFVDFLKHGQGEQIFTNGDRYVGQYKQGKPNGKGKYQWADGSYYQGDFVKGVRQGYGVWKYTNGTLYQGEFKNDFKSGRGKQRYKTGQRFQGQFKQGQKYQGTLYDINNIGIQITP